ncbi:MAG: aminoacetone oxidase family FAD-binding enzyme [Endomicrobiia bacterium]
MNESYDVIIIGCGTSCGFLISFLKEKKFVNFPKILIIEKNPVLFKKILATGNGRCNFSNLSFSKENYYSISADLSWREKVFNKILNLDLKKYFYDNGIFYSFDEYGRVFPYTKSSKTITNYFISNIKSSDVNLMLNTEVKKVLKIKDGYKLLIYNKQNLKEDFVNTKVLIFACGGKAYPKFGTDGKCFEILKDLGHNCTKILCGIVPLVTETKDFYVLEGIKMECGVKYKSFYRKGEVLFTNYGISGPNVLYISNLVSIELQKGKVVLEIDFLPEKYMTLDFYKNIFYKKNGCSLTEIFSGSLNEKFINVVIAKIFGKTFDVKKKTSLQDLEKFYFGIKNYKMTVVKTKTFDEAQVSIGGISCNEINEETFESTINSGIYFMGEVIDFTGGCGGYNIHFCAVCGKTVSDEIYKRFG